MADPDAVPDLPNDGASTEHVLDGVVVAAGGESDSLATRPDPEPRAPLRTGFDDDRCAHPGCTEGAKYCGDHDGQDFSITPTVTEPEPFTGLGDPGSDDADIAALRRDVARLEGKVDALLEALEVADGDGP